MPDAVSSARPAGRPDARAADLEPLPPELTSIQPGGGYVMRLELAWGHVRRAWLHAVGRRYIERMRRLRKGDRNPAPHEVLDPRDVKFYANQPGGYHWDEADDPYAWRGRLGFARWGLAELIVFATSGAIVTYGFFAPAYAVPQASIATRLFLLFLSFASLVVTALLVWFFRDPYREVPTKPGQVVSPADGTVAEVTELDHHPFVGGPAVKIGIFLSIFNVHVNRWPVAAKVVGLDYKPGKYLNALDPMSALVNDQLHVRLESTDPADGPPRRMAVHLIAGLIARRIVCVVKPGDELPRGHRIGMIKLGSRTEIVVPSESGLRVLAKRGDKVKGGFTVLAEYDAADGPGSSGENERHAPHPGPPPVPLS